MRKIAKYTVVAINAFFALLYIFGLLAAVVPANEFVWFSYFGLIFPILTVIQICFVLFWLCKRNWWFLLSLLLLIFSYQSVNQVFSIPWHKTTYSEKLQQITLLTYNVSLFGGEKCFDDIVQFIADTDADIVCLQEFGFYHKSSRLNQQKLLERFDAIYPYRHIWYKNQRNRFWWGVATFSKFPIVNKKKVEYASAYNVSVYSDIVIAAGDTVRVFNNHLESNKLTSSDLKKYKLSAETFDNDGLRSATETMANKLSAACRARAKQANSVAATIARTPYPVVVCGDFNDVVQSYTYHTLARGMTDAVTATSWGYNYTFHANGLLVGIDHILLDEQHFAPIASRIAHIDFSDHYPVVATFAVK